MQHKKKWNLIGSEIAFSNKFVTIRKDWITNPNGQNLDYYTVTSEPLVAIFALNSKNEILITNQFRVSIKKYISGLPGGRIEDSESILNAGKRELLEETGYSAKNLKILSKIYLDPGRSEKMITILQANNIVKINSSNDGEINNLKWISIDKAISEVISGKIEDPVAQYAILFYFVKKSRNRERLKN